LDAVQNLVGPTPRAGRLPELALRSSKLDLAMFALSNEDQTTVRCVDASGEKLCDLNLYPTGKAAHYRCRHTPPHCYDLSGRPLSSCP
jgi:hypothetical protein